MNSRNIISLNYGNNCNKCSCECYHKTYVCIYCTKRKSSEKINKPESAKSLIPCTTNDEPLVRSKRPFFRNAAAQSSYLQQKELSVRTDSFSLIEQNSTIENIKVILLEIGVMPYNAIPPRPNAIAKKSKKPLQTIKLPPPSSPPSSPTPPPSPFPVSHIDDDLADSRSSSPLPAENVSPQDDYVYDCKKAFITVCSRSCNKM
jgi:hypothetical protein